MGVTASELFQVLAAASAVASVYLTSREIQEVNKKISPELHISHSFFMYSAKIRHIKNMYRRLYPEGRIDRWRIVFQAAVLAFIALPAALYR